MYYTEILSIAEHLKEQLAPHCARIEIAGSIRRKKAEPNDIELVAIPKEYNTGLFESGIALVLNQYRIIKGHLPCKYTQRWIPGPSGMMPVKLDFFTATPDNWGYIMAIRTGSADFSHKLANAWVSKGYHGKEGTLYNADGFAVIVPTEEHLFSICGMKYVAPEDRI